PSDAAASSSSVPRSVSTGTTSRITSGNEINAVAITMPGVEKIMSMLRSPSHCPNHESVGPYTRMSANPTTTGDTDHGTATSAESTLRPGNEYRTSSNDMPTPKTVFSTTA